MQSRFSKEDAATENEEEDEDGFNSNGPMEVLMIQLGGDGTWLNKLKIAISQGQTVVVYLCAVLKRN